MLVVLYLWFVSIYVCIRYVCQVNWETIYSQSVRDTLVLTNLTRHEVLMESDALAVHAGKCEVDLRCVFWREVCRQTTTRSRELEFPMCARKLWMINEKLWILLIINNAICNDLSPPYLVHPAHACLQTSLCNAEIGSGFTWPWYSILQYHRHTVQPHTTMLMFSDMITVIIYSRHEYDLCHYRYFHHVNALQASKTRTMCKLCE